MGSKERGSGQRANFSIPIGYRNFTKNLGTCRGVSARRVEKGPQAVDGLMFSRVWRPGRVIVNGLDAKLGRRIEILSSVVDKHDTTRIVAAVFDITCLETTD